MNKLLSFLLLIFILCLSSCSNKKPVFKREIAEINLQVFFGIDNKNDSSSLIKRLIINVNNAFHLKQIEISPSKTEVRIYYIDPFGERFFRQNFLNGNTEMELYRCKTDRKKDSLFLNIKSSIKSSGKYQHDNSFDPDGLPEYSTIMMKDTTDAIMDNGSVYLIQIKNNFKSKFILIKDPFEIEEKNITTKYVCQLIGNINKKFSFKFYDSWGKTINSAFLNISCL